MKLITWQASEAAYKMGLIEFRCKLPLQIMADGYKCASVYDLNMQNVTTSLPSFIILVGIKCHTDALKLISQNMR